MISCSVSALRRALFLVAVLLCNAVLLLAQPVNDSRVKCNELTKLTNRGNHISLAYHITRTCGNGYAYQGAMSRNAVG